MGAAWFCAGCSTSGTSGKACGGRKRGTPGGIWSWTGMGCARCVTGGGAVRWAHGGRSESGYGTP